MTALHPTPLLFATSLPTRLRGALPGWAQQWLEVIVPLVEVALILLAAWALRWLLRRLIARLARRHDLPTEVVVGARRVGGFIIFFGALLLALERFGVSGSVLWTAFTGFAAVAAVAFFAAWSVLTNVFCAFLIMITRPFRLRDHIELLENGEKPGLRGQVVDVNLIYVTLRESHPQGGESELRVPNSLFFQRATRRWQVPPPPPVHTP
ncbi:MAG: mechanosensitive ion channel family protein [Pseudoxanthomonas sp.]